MKKEEFKQAIDNIQPDIHMRTRLQAKILYENNALKRNKNYGKRIIAVCLTAVIIFCAALLSYKPAPNNPDTGTDTEENFSPQIIKAFIVVASAADTVDMQTESPEKTLELNEEYPYKINLSYTDTRGKTEKEKKKILDDLYKKQEEYFSDKSFSFGASAINSLSDVFISEYSLNQFKLNIENIDMLECIRVSNTSPYGQMVYNNQKKATFAPVKGHDIIINADDFNAKRCGFFWNHTEELEKAVNQNPDLPFSTFDDTITFTVEYSDGSKAVGVVELNFDSAGNAATVCKSYEYQKAGDDSK